MLSRFPHVEELGPVTEHEWQTLRSLNRAYVDLRHEWEAAIAQTNRLLVKGEIAEGYADPGGRYPHHRKALDGLFRPAHRYERHVGSLTWRYASAAVVLGMAVADRLICDRPPLAVEVVDVLAATEPSLGALKEACDEPYLRLIDARADDASSFEAKDRDLILAGLDSAGYNAAHLDVDGRRLAPAEIETCQLSVVSQEGHDALWEDLLEPMLGVAESVPYTIALLLDRRLR